MKRGKFIVIYGINNLGKSTQVRLLVDKLLAEGRKAKFLKVPTYSTEPSGTMLNEYLREGNPYGLTPREAQILYAFNRSQFEPELVGELESGCDVVAEDYWGTGVAWGIGAGVDKDFLLRVNKACLREDLALLFVGKRFTAGLEAGHLHENNERLVGIVDQAHRDLAKEFGWKTINANQSIEAVAKDVWGEVKKLL